jgi:hypothetical protein
MLRRWVVPLVVTIAVAFAPAAVAACEASCAMEAAAEHAPVAHPCHHARASADRTDGSSVSGAPHGCNHFGDLSATCAGDHIALSGPAVASVLDEVRVATRPTAVVIAGTSPPPIYLGHRVPLRV